MKTALLLKEYVWLLNTISQARKITLEEINRKWKKTEMSCGAPLTRATFIRHKKDIESIFDVNIECDKKDGNKYYIENPEVLHENNIQNWMLSTFSVNTIISDSKSVHNRIQLESVPSGGDFLHQVIDAMKRNVRVTIGYCKYQSTEMEYKTVAPYCVKLFHRRWYLLGYRQNKKVFRIYAFDRIKTLNITKESFVIDSSFCVDDYFKDSYGIMVGDEIKVEKVVLRAFSHEVYYMRDLPVHHSQHEIVTETNFSDFELHLCPTLDFIGHLLSRGAYIKVLKPAWLAEKILESYKKSFNLYEKS